MLRRNAYGESSRPLAPPWKASSQNGGRGDSAFPANQPMNHTIATSLIVLSLVICPAARPQSSPPRVSSRFAEEVRRLAAEGLRLKEAVEASLDGRSSHLAAIFERAKPKSPNESNELRIIEASDQGQTTIFRRSEFFFSFASNEQSARNATDINGDGLKEIIVQSSSGGNCWSCNPTEIYRVKNHKAELIAAGPISRIADLDGDGQADLLVADSRWEVYGDLSHAAAPSSLMIYAWRDGRYVYASRDFPAFYKSEIERLKGEVEGTRAAITEEEFSDDAYIGRAVSLAITIAQLGDVERAIAELQSVLNSSVRSSAQRKRRAAIIEDFKSGESAKKLREIKYGDPLPF